MTLPDNYAQKALFADPETLYSQATDQVSADLNGDMAILNLQTKTYFGLADVGAFIWKKLETPTDFASLTQAVVAEFEVTTDRCSQDVTAFLEKLASLGLLKLRTAPNKNFKFL